MNDTVTELPIKTRSRVKNHAWERTTEQRIHGTEFPDGNGRTYRFCANCPVIKITVHPPAGYGWREWGDRRDPSIRVIEGPTPACTGELAE